MAGNRKLKLLYIIDILLNNTDENHAVKISDIIESLSKLGIKAERKSLYDDIKALKEYGLDIEGYNEGKSYYYYIKSRLFDKDEISLMIKAIDKADFIDKAKKERLAEKCLCLLSVNER